LKGDLNFVEKKLLERVESKSFIPHSELTTQDKFILPGLRDFLVPLKVKYGDSELVVWKHYAVPNEKIMPSISEMLKKTVPKVEVPKEKPRETIFERKEVKAEVPAGGVEVPAGGVEVPAGVFQTRVNGWFSNYNVEIVKSEVKRKGKELEFIIRMKTPVEQEYYVKCKDKKRISESDITLTYTEAMQKKMPAIFMTSGKVSKKILKTIDKKFGGLVSVVII
jgi:hypothetical protein